MHKKRKVIIETIPVDNEGIIKDNNELSQSKIDNLRKNNINSIVLITSDAVDADSYRSLVLFYKNAGLKVRTLFLSIYEENSFQTVYSEVVDIYRSLTRGGCLIASYGYGFAAVLYASFLIYSGRNVAETIKRIQKKDYFYLSTDDEIEFLKEFYIRFGQMKVASPVVSDSSQVSNQEPETDISQKILTIEKKEQELAKQEIRKELEAERQREIDIESPIVSNDEEKVKEKDIIQKEEVVKTEKVKVDKKQKKKKLKDKTEKNKHTLSKKEQKKIDKELEVKTKHGKSSLRFKLIFITSIIVILSFSGMISLATYFFREDSTIRIQENNHKISGIIALKVETDFQTLIEKARYRFENILLEKSNDQESLNKILQNDKDFLYMAIAKQTTSTNEFEIDIPVFNTNLMNEIQVSNSIITQTNNDEKDSYINSFKGLTVIHNVSQFFKHPIIGLSFPFKEDSRNNIVICYVKLERFLQTFKPSGIIHTYMVNEKGDIVAHPEASVVLSSGNVVDNPIVKMMIKSTQDNGQTSYINSSGVKFLGSFKKITFGGCGVIATVEEEVALKAVNAILVRNFYLMMIILTVVILVVYFFAKTLTSPIIRLVGATNKIKKGDYDINIRVTTHDEIGELTNSFIEMGEGLAEREKIKTAFGKFVNPELAEMVLKDEIKLGGETKHASILFSDIRSFTAISERMEPKDVVEFLNEYMTSMVDCIERSNGIVDKFIGDAIMAVWGVPVSKGNDVENSINGALFMRDALIEFNKDRGSDEKPIISIGCGINAGEVLAGQIGSENRMEYTVIGDAVNLASRIEALNKPFGTDILISEDTYNECKDIFIVEKMTPIKVKGKEKPQLIYAVISRKDSQDGPKNIDELRNLIGIKGEFSISSDDLEKEEKYEILS